MTTKEFNFTIQYIYDNVANPVTKTWFLIDSPFLMLSIIVSYLLFCIKIGPWYMKDRRPYNLNTVMKIYNVVQILISLFILVMAIYRLFFTDFNFKCQNSVPDSEFFLLEAKVSYLYFAAKITELLDSVFFVLRKSYRQLTFLHLFHHTLMPVVCWYGVLYYPGGNGAIMALFNSLVHVVMYSYYLIASLGGKYKKILWWKKYVTIMQLVQFVIVGLHSARSLSYDCGYPTHMKWMVVVQGMFFMKMFGQFYYNTYCKSDEKSKKSLNGVHRGETSKTS